MIQRAYRYRLYPTPEQETALRQFIGATRFVYNLCLEQRRDFWRQFQARTGRRIGWASQSTEVSQLRKEVDWIAAVPRMCLEQALRDLDKAYANFFSGRARHPKPRTKGQADAIRFQWKDTRLIPLNAKWASVRLPNLTPLKFRLTRPIRGDIRNVTISLVAGQWFASFACDVEHEAPANIAPAVGLDRGVANTISLSTGEHFSVPGSLAALDKIKRRKQRSLARKKRGSNRRAAQLRHVSRVSAKIARIRKDWQHRVSTDLAQRFGTVAMEKLVVTNMTASNSGTREKPGKGVAQKRGLNRSILNQGWSAFATMLTYKLEERGGSVIYVDPAYTSQTCSDCGAVDRESRKSQARFACVHCGFTAHADHNAAINILRRSTSGVDGPDCGAVEARTINPVVMAGGC